MFLSTKMFEERIKKGYFLEWEKVFDHYYGTPKKQALNLLKKGINVLLCIDVKGARTVAQEVPAGVENIYQSAFHESFGSPSKSTEALKAGRV